MMLADTKEECAWSHLETWKAKLGADVFCVSQVVTNLINLTFQLCCPCGSSSMAYLIQTLPQDAVSFLTYGSTIADVGPV